MRNSNIYRTNFSEPNAAERVISALSYLTAGLVGFIWLIFTYVTGKPPRPFIKFHVFQSIFISILYYLAGIIFGILFSFLKIIPFIGTLMLNLVYYIAQQPIVLGYSILHFVIILIMVYLIITALQGKYSRLPWVSDTIKQMV